MDYSKRIRRTQNFLPCEVNFPLRPVADPDPPEGADVTGGGTTVLLGGGTTVVVTGGVVLVVVGAAVPGKHLQECSSVH